MRRLSLSLRLGLLSTIRLGIGSSAVAADRVVAVSPVVGRGTFAATGGRYGPSGFSTTGGGMTCDGNVSGTGPVGHRGPVGAGRLRVLGSLSDLVHKAHE